MARDLSVSHCRVHPRLLNALVLWLLWKSSFICCLYHASLCCRSRCLLSSFLSSFCSSSKVSSLPPKSSVSVLYHCASLGLASSSVVSPLWRHGFAVVGGWGVLCVCSRLSRSPSLTLLSILVCITFSVCSSFFLVAVSLSLLSMARRFVASPSAVVYSVCGGVSSIVLAIRLGLRRVPLLLVWVHVVSLFAFAFVLHS